MFKYLYWKSRQKQTFCNVEKTKPWLTERRKWSLCLLWTAPAKCWSLACGSRFSSSSMSRIPTTFASTRSKKATRYTWNFGIDYRNFSWDWKHARANAKLPYSILAPKVLSKVRQNSASLMDKCKTGERAALFDNQREGIRRMHNSSETCAGEKGADTGAVMYLHEQTPGYKCEVTDEKICGERTCLPAWKSQGHVLHHCWDI